MTTQRQYIDNENTIAIQLLGTMFTELLLHGEKSAVSTSKNLSVVLRFFVVIIGKNSKKSYFSDFEVNCAVACGLVIVDHNEKSSVGAN